MKLSSLILGIAVVFIIWFLIPFVLIMINGYLAWPVVDNIFLEFLGALLLTLALLPILHSFFLFRKFGQGTPVPIQPPKKFVVKGLYKYSRNPMYICYMLTFLSLFFIFGHLTLSFYFLISFPVIHFLVVRLEEPILKKRFGREYIDYLKKVPRWL